MTAFETIIVARMGPLLAIAARFAAHRGKSANPVDCGSHSSAIFEFGVVDGGNMLDRGGRAQINRAAFAQVLRVMLPHLQSVLILRLVLRVVRICLHSLVLRTRGLWLSLQLLLCLTESKCKTFVLIEPHLGGFFSLRGAVAHLTHPKLFLFKIKIKVSALHSW